MQAPPEKVVGLIDDFHKLGIVVAVGKS